MNLVNECPVISDSWKGGITAAAKILGLDRKTLGRYAALGKREGGIDWKISPRTGRKQFLGKEIKRFWNQF